MKTKLSIYSTAILTFAVCLCLAPNPLLANDFTQLVSSKFEVLDKQDRQVLSCNTYQLDNNIFYENPNTIRFYPNNRYLFSVDFAYFTDKTTVTTNDIEKGSYSIRIPSSQRDNYEVVAISPKNGQVMIDAKIFGEAGTLDTFRLQLVDKNATLLADAIFPFDIQSDDPDATFTTFMQINVDYQPIYLTLEDANNPNNRIERQLLPFGPDTINVNAKDVFNVFTEIEHQVYINDEAHVLVADHENNFGYQVNVGWEGKALANKPGNNNGLFSYLTVVPKKKQGPVRVFDVRSIMADNLKKAKLNQSGTRIKQQYNFMPPNTAVKKIYSNAYLQKHPNISRFRTSQRGLSHIIKHQLPVVQKHLKLNNQKFLTSYQAKPMVRTQPKVKTNIQKRTPTKTPPTRTTPSNAKIQKTTPMRTYPATTKPTKTNPRLKQNKIVTKPTTRATATAPAATHRNVYVVPTQPSKDKFYTMAIEVARETDILPYQTYFVTFRVIE